MMGIQCIMDNTELRTMQCYIVRRMLFLEEDLGETGYATSYESLSFQNSD